VIRLVDANAFGDPGTPPAGGGHPRRRHPEEFRGGRPPDTVVRRPELLRLWKRAGLRSVVVGFEEIEDAVLAS